MKGNYRVIIPSYYICICLTVLLMFLGFMCDTRGLSFPSHMCPAGSYCPGGKKNSKTCSPGSRCPPGSDRQIPCLPGTYQNLPGQVRNMKMNGCLFLIGKVHILYSCHDCDRVQAIYRLICCFEKYLKK